MEKQCQMFQVTFHKLPNYEVIFISYTRGGGGGGGGGDSHMEGTGMLVGNFEFNP